MSGTVPAGSKLLAAVLGVPPWTAMAGSYTNSWSDFGSGQVTGQYRLWKLRNCVELVGTISHASTSGNSNFFTMPSALFPATAQFVGMGEATSGAGCCIIISTAGVLTVVSLPASTTTLQFNGWYSLDA